MKLPTLDFQPKAPQRTMLTVSPHFAPAQTQGVEAMSRAFGAVADTAGHAADMYMQARAKAQAEADALRMANADVEFERAQTRFMRGDNTTAGRIDAAFTGADGEGFLSSKGLTAAEKSADTLEKLDEERKRIADTLPPTLQQSWLARSAGRFEDSRRQVETHVAQQVQAARVETAKAKQQRAVDEAYNLGLEGGPGAEESANRLAAEVEADLGKLALSPEHAEAMKREFRSDVTLARIKARLSKEDVAGARAAFEALGSNLEPKQAEQIQHVLKEAEKKQQAKLSAIDLEDQVGAILDSARGADTYVDESKALAVIQRLPAEKRNAARDLLAERLRDEEARKKADIEKAKVTARGLWNEGGMTAVRKSGIDVWLNKYDPEYLARLQDDSRARYRQWKADQRGDAAARREQATADKTAFDEFQALDKDQRASANVEEWATGRGISPGGVAHLKMLQRKATEDVDKGADKQESRFVSESVAVWRATAPKAQKTGPNELALRAQLSRAYEAARAANGGKDLSPTEVEAERAKLLADSVLESHWYGDKHGPEFLRRQREADAAKQQPEMPAPQKAATVRMRFPNGVEAEVPQDKLEAARRKGGVEVQQ